MTKAERKEFEAMVNDALKKAMQQQSQKEWYTEEELLEKFGNASVCSIARFRRSGLVEIARSPFCPKKFLYSRADVDALVASSIVPKSNQQRITVSDQQFK